MQGPEEGPREGAAGIGDDAIGAGGSVGGFEQPPQLDLGEEDVRLPWLEGDDEELEEQGGPGMAQGFILGLLGLIAIGLIAGGIYWATQGEPERQLVADGGVIAAPKEPYKTQPDDPGGEVVAGTGDTSFAVAEGQSRLPQIDQKEAAPGPGFQSMEKPVKVAPAAKDPAAKESAAKEEAPVSGVGVQVGAYTSKTAAEAGWNTLKSQYPDLSGIKHRIVEGKADIGTVYRLQAVPGDLAAAKALCGGMKSAGLSCQVKN
jgi:hypothetical protein